MMRLWPLVGWVIAAGSSIAHEDPVGDVHPSITVEGGNFVVWFYNNAPSKERSVPSNGRFKIVLAQDGKDVSARTPVPSPPDSAPDLADKLHSTNPFRSKTNGGAELPLGWKGEVTDSGGYSEKNGRLLFHFSGAESDKFPLYLGAYDLGQQRLTASALVGIPGRIYNFAVASNVIAVGENAYVAWIQNHLKWEKHRTSDRPAENMRIAYSQLVLSKWRIGGEQLAHMPIRQTYGSNSHIAIEVIDDRLLIAWHEGPAALVASKIGTEVIPLKSADFDRTILYSSKKSILEDEFARQVISAQGK